MRMFLVFFLTSTLALSSASCEKIEVAGGTPKCIEKEIREFNQNSSCDDASVGEYWFQNETVFTFEPGTCGADMQTIVFDSKCNRLGALGGIQGNTKINGEDFSNAEFVRVVWEK
ncbi:MAG: DUF6970 domain-containing protein [Bacteroidia bacterium]